MTSASLPSARPVKHRPRIVWFFVGGGLLLLGVLSFIGGLVLALYPLTIEDAVFAADGRPHSVSLPPGEERAVFTDQAAVDCSAVDAGGNEVEIRGPGGEYTSDEWDAIGRFDTGDGDLVFTCTSSAPGAEARIGGIPAIGTFVGGLLLGIVGPLVFGLAGFVLLIVTTVLFATRPARPR